jgi:hypothetical protein
MKSKRMRLAWNVACMGRRGMHIGLWWESQKERDNYRGPRRRWEDRIKMDLREIEWGIIHQILMAQDREQWRALVNTVMNLRLPKIF